MPQATVIPDKLHKVDRRKNVVLNQSEEDIADDAQRCEARFGSHARTGDLADGGNLFPWQIIIADADGGTTFGAEVRRGIVGGETPMTNWNSIIGDGFRRLFRRFFSGCFPQPAPENLPQRLLLPFTP